MCKQHNPPGAPSLFDDLELPKAYLSGNGNGLTGYEDYNDEIARFRESKLYDQKFESFLRIIHAHDHENPITSPELERKLGVSGAHVRGMAKVARWLGYPVLSFGRGYGYAREAEELTETIQHMEERARSISCTTQQLKKIQRRMKVAEGFR